MALIFFVTLSVMNAGIRKDKKSSQRYHKVAKSLETSLHLRQPEVLFRGWKALHHMCFSQCETKRMGFFIKLYQSIILKPSRKPSGSGLFQSI